MEREGRGWEVVVSFFFFLGGGLEVFGRVSGCFLILLVCLRGFEKVFARSPEL